MTERKSLLLKENIALNLKRKKQMQNTKKKKQTPMVFRTFTIDRILSNKIRILFYCDKRILLVWSFLS